MAKDPGLVLHLLYMLRVDLTFQQHRAILEHILAQAVYHLRKIQDSLLLIIIIVESFVALLSLLHQEAKIIINKECQAITHHLPPAVILEHQAILLATINPTRQADAHRAAISLEPLLAVTNHLFLGIRA